MSFVDVFVDDLDEPDPSEPPVEHERPEWLGPPNGELGVAVPLGVILGRTERGVVAVSHALAYSSGVSFELVAHVGGLKPRQINSLFHEQHAGGVAVAELPEGFLRFGIERGDGKRVSNLGSRRQFGTPEDGPRGPVLIQKGGGGGQSSGTSISWSLGYWLWPLPPEGRLRLYCEWPVAQIQLTQAEIDAGPILEAANRTPRLWNSDEGGGGWTASVGEHVMQTHTTDEASAPPGQTGPDETVTLPAAQVRELEAALRGVLSLLRQTR